MVLQAAPGYNSNDKNKVLDMAFGGTNNRKAIAESIVAEIDGDTIQSQIDKELGTSTSATTGKGTEAAADTLADTKQIVDSQRRRSLGARASESKKTSAAATEQKLASTGRNWMALLMGDEETTSSEITKSREQLLAMANPDSSNISNPIVNNEVLDNPIDTGNGLMSVLRPKIRSEANVINSTIRPKIRNNSAVLTSVVPKVREAKTSPEITSIVAGALPAEAGVNPVSFIFNGDLMGLDETNEDHQAVLRGFLNSATGDAKYPAVNSDVTKDSYAWCAAFVDNVLGNLGYSQLDYGKDQYNKVRAKQYLNYGSAVKDTATAVAGDLVVLQNPETGRYHVSFFVGLNDQGEILALGGNQEDAVKVSAYDTSRLKGIRRISNVSDMNPKELKKVTASFVPVPKSEESQS